ncbi:MAG: hypothetical protein ACIPMY_06995 [Rickettsia endosymbiont of Pentastiridius leporinus]
MQLTAEQRAKLEEVKKKVSKQKAQNNQTFQNFNEANEQVQTYNQNLEEEVELSGWCCCIIL